MQAPWRNLRGPARSLAISATILLVASALGGVEAGIMIVLGPARDALIKPFILLGYLEACAMFFSLIAIVISIVCLIFYQPYLYIREKIFLYRARHAAQVSDEHIAFEEVRPVSTTRIHNPEEDGAPD